MRNPLKIWFGKQTLPPNQKDTDSYFEKLIKYIPADIVAAYLTVDGILKEQLGNPTWLPWAVFGFLAVLTPFYVCFMKTQPPGITAAKTFHWVASTFAFIVFVFALGGPFASTFDWYRPVYGSVALILTTLLLPLGENYVNRNPLPTDDKTGDA